MIGIVVILLAFQTIDLLAMLFRFVTLFILFVCLLNEYKYLKASGCMKGRCLVAPRYIQVSLNATAHYFITVSEAFITSELK